MLRLCTCNVIMKTHDGFYRQIDGLAMGSPPAPLLANGWLSTYDPRIRGMAQLFARYMDDILRSIKRAEVQEKLAEINSYHPFLKFTIEEEDEQSSLPFLDMLIYRIGTKIYSTWYNPDDESPCPVPKAIQAICGRRLCSLYSSCVQSKLF